MKTSAAKRVAPFALGDSTSDLVYTTLLQPCRIIDTRLAGGPLTSARDFKVAGSSSFAAQGGNAAGCGIPAGGATAVMINFVAVNPTGAGNLRGSAFPNPVPAVGSIINYQSLSPPLNVANGVAFPICDSSVNASCGTADITIQPNGATTDLVADVIGYFSSYLAGPPTITYTTLPQPCRIIDTRVGGGSLSAGVPRHFKVAGTSGFEAQGGTAGGCAVPAGAKVAMINFVAVNGQGAGNLKGSSYPNPIPATGSVINYQLLNPALNIANGLLFPICDLAVPMCTSDITLQPNGSGTDVVADVLGYFSAGLQPPVSTPNTQQKLTYTTFQQPCRIIDTRANGGMLSSGIPRNFKVAGTSGFDLQGGTAGGCGVPVGATVAMINFVAVGAQGAGNLKGSAYPNPIPATGNVINYQLLDPALNIANGLLFPVCDPAVAGCSSDMTLQANVAGVHVVADVMGYAKRTLPIDLTVDLSPANTTIAPGGTVGFTVTIGSQAQPATVYLAVNPANAGTLPLSVVLPANQTSATFMYTDAGTTSAATITATYGSSQSQANVTVVIPTPNHLVINEVDYDQIGTDTAEFIEIYNPTSSAIDLTNKAIMLVNGNGNTVYDTVSLSAPGTLASHAYLVIAGANVSVPPPATKIDPGWTQDRVQNGSPDGIALVDTASHTLIDSLSYEGSITMVMLTGFSGPVSLVEGTALNASVADSNAVAGSLCRLPNGQDADDANADWQLCTTVTAGTANP